ncbi:hypothetical protein MKW92_040044 [Papaver armeniacum]|nr:hypothetical protein MKW92_040044 [Papaver armeniacum]
METQAAEASQKMEVERAKEEDEEKMSSPTASQKSSMIQDLIIEMSYGFTRKEKGRDSVAFLTCPTCFTTLFSACKKHEKYLTQCIAVFVGNCKIKISQILQRSYHKPKTSNKGGRDHDTTRICLFRYHLVFRFIDEVDASTRKHLSLRVASTEVGVIANDEVYHFSLFFIVSP